MDSNTLKVYTENPDIQTHHGYLLVDRYQEGIITLKCSCITDIMKVYVSKNLMYSKSPKAILI